MKQASADHMEVFSSLPDCARTALPTVCALYDVGPATVWRRVKTGLIPAPVKEGGGTRWIVGDLRKALSISAPPTKRAGAKASMAREHGVPVARTAPTRAIKKQYMNLREEVANTWVIDLDVQAPPQDLDENLEWWSRVSGQNGHPFRRGDSVLVITQAWVAEYLVFKVGAGESKTVVLATMVWAKEPRWLEVTEDA